MFEQTFTQMSEVSVWVSRGSPAFVHLCHMHASPRDRLVRQSPEHKPRGVAAAERRDESTVRGDAGPSLCGDDPGRFPSDRIGICKHLDLHESPSDPDQAVTTGSRHPSRGLKGCWVVVVAIHIA